MKKTLVFIFLSIFSLSALFFSAKKNTNENKLFCDENGDFSILIVSDPQCDTKKEWCEARDELEILINRSNPNLVIINGDMNSKNYIPYDMWEMFIKPITSRNIYWSTTNGNHDPFSQKNYNMYKKYDTCLNSLMNSKDKNYEYKRPMNYVIPIYSNNGKNIVFAVFCMDTGSINKYGYEGVTKKQINWYIEQSNKLKKQNDERAVTSVLCMHIPLIQTLDMFYSSKNFQEAIPKKSGGRYKVYGVTNQHGEGTKNYVCEDGTKIKQSFIHTTAQKNDRGFFNKILKQGDIKAIIFGHEHNTNIIGSYKGVLLGFAGKLSTGCYSDIYCRGGRIIRFNEKNPDIMFPPPEFDGVLI